MVWGKYFIMIPGLNPRKMQQMMRQLGIQQTEVPAYEVIIRSEDKEIIITNPSVAKVNMMGQESFQISGEVHERNISSELNFSEDDIRMVIDQTGVTREKAEQSLKLHKGDLAETILSLKNE